MIKASFLKKQVAKAASQKRTPPFLRRLIARSVTHAAEVHYGDALSMKCLQVSRGAQILLQRMGIESQLWIGAFCAAEIYAEWGHDGWGGFWDADHHVWLTTEFYELVDLSTGYKHLHPLTRRRDGVAMPTVWWDDITIWPSVIRYLPDTKIKAGFPPGDDGDDLAVFEGRCSAYLDNMIANLTVDEITFAPMLEDPDGMSDRYDTGDLWLRRAATFEQVGLKLPDWILEREAELIAAHRRGVRAPSRLTDRPDLFA